MVENARVRGKNDRIIIPGGFDKCSVCTKGVKGVHAPYGETLVCANAGCLLIAQQKDLRPRSTDLVVPTKPLQIGKFPQYCGVMLAYKGDGRWVLGFVNNDEERTRLWIDNITYEQAEQYLEQNRRFIVRQDEKDIFGV